MQAYQGQTPFIESGDVLEAAISIHPVEARHAAWIRNIVGMNPAPQPFDAANSKAAVLKVIYLLAVTAVTFMLPALSATRPLRWYLVPALLAWRGEANRRPGSSRSVPTDCP